MKIDVMIVGAGLTGVSAAFALKNQGMKVLLVEREIEVKDRFRGEYLQPSAVRGLEKLGLGDIFEKVNATTVQELRFRDLDTVNQVNSQILIKYPAHSHARVMTNKTLVEELRIRAREKLGESFLEGAKVEPVNQKNWRFLHRPLFTIRKADGNIVSCEPKYVIGADGKQSLVREWMNNPKASPQGAPTFGAQPEFIVGCELLEGAGNPGRYEVIRTAGNGTLSFFQINQTKQRVYWNAPATKGLTHKKHWETELRKLLQVVKPHLRLHDITIENVAGAAANTTWNGPSAKGCFFLAGDALAVTTPFGGQGMSCSYQHIEKLSELLSSGQSLSSCRKQYETFARGVYRHVNILNFGLYYLFFARNPMFKYSTRHILKTWSEHPEMSERLGRLFGGDDMDTPDLYEISRLWGLKIPALRLVQG